MAADEGVHGTATVDVSIRLKPWKQDAAVFGLHLWLVTKNHGNKYMITCIQDTEMKWQLQCRHSKHIEAAVAQLMQAWEAVVGSMRIEYVSVTSRGVGSLEEPQVICSSREGQWQPLMCRCLVHCLELYCLADGTAPGVPAEDGETDDTD